MDRENGLLMEREMSKKIIIYILVLNFKQIYEEDVVTPQKDTAKNIIDCGVYFFFLEKDNLSSL